jgi:pimeloyl-ACP methyl ester carboxylesterase
MTGAPRARGIAGRERPFREYVRSQGVGIDVTVTRVPGRHHAAAAALAVALAICCFAASPADARGRAISSKPVTFSVQNVNRSNLACGTDGATYQVRGHLVGPRAAVASSSRRRKHARAVTLYLHGFGFGEWFWDFSAAPGYDYASLQAKSGHTSVVIDRLGYDSSGHSDGNRSCLGGQADVAHQVVQQLRKGSYSVANGKPIRFGKIALAGHSAGGEIADIEAYSFKDVNALIVMSFSYSNLPRAQIALGPTRDKCLAGGEPAEPGAPSGYAFFGQPTAADYQAIMFADSTPSVLEAATALRNRDPCGDTASIVPALLQQRPFVAKLKLPVLIVCGTRDALYSSLGCGQQRDRYTRSRSRRLELIKGAGHALTLGRSAKAFRKKVGRWLGRRGF